MSVQYEAPNSGSVKSDSVKDVSSPVGATVENHIYQEISSTEHEVRMSIVYVLLGYG